MKRNNLVLLVLMLSTFILFVNSGVCSDVATSLLPIYIPEKEITKYQQYVLVKGRWREKEGFNQLLAKVNIVDIRCDKDSMVCVETIANVQSMEENEILKIHKTNLLSLGIIKYKIIEWTNDDTIVAINDAPVADMEIKISLKDNFAERSVRETKARGDGTADSNVYSHWVLE